MSSVIRAKWLSPAHWIGVASIGNLLYGQYVASGRTAPRRSLCRRLPGTCPLCESPGETVRTGKPSPTQCTSVSPRVPRCFLAYIQAGLCTYHCRIGMAMLLARCPFRNFRMSLKHGMVAPACTCHAILLIGIHTCEGM